MTTFNLPDLGEGLAEAEIVRWHVSVGDRVKVDQPMVAIETAKAVVEVPSPYSGVIKALHGKPGDVIATGSPLVEFELDAPESAPRAPEPKAPDPRKADDSGTVVGSMPTSDEELIETAVAGGQAPQPQQRVRAAPAVRALAKRLGVDLTRIRGSGRGGLITVDDVMNASGPTGMHAAAAATALRESVPAARPGVTPAPVSGEAEKLRGLRRAMAQSMSLARDNVASCTLFDDADLHRWRPGQDITARLVRAIVAACRAEPALNAWFDGENLTRTLHPHVDIGIAVDTPDGLFVPALRNADMLDAQGVRAGIDRLRQQVEDRSIPPGELTGYTISLSNFGMFAGRYATPVVVPPCVAIVGAGRLSHDVVAVMGGIEVHRRLPISLTFDHRACTGGEAARFLRALLDDMALPQ